MKQQGPIWTTAVIAAVLLASTLFLGKKLLVGNSPLPESQIAYPQPDVPPIPEPNQKRQVLLDLPEPPPLPPLHERQQARLDLPVPPDAPLFHKRQQVQWDLPTPPDDPPSPVE